MLEIVGRPGAAALIARAANEGSRRVASESRQRWGIVGGWILTASLMKAVDLRFCLLKSDSNQQPCD